jgi:site-specific recombinase XerD
MHEDGLAYLRCLRLRIASTTFRQRFFATQRFFRWLDERKNTWQKLTRQDIEAYLLAINGKQQSRQQVWRVLRDFYTFHKWHEPPTTGIIFRKEPTKLPKVPSQPLVDEKIRYVSGPEPQIALRNRLMAELAYGSGLRRRELSLLDVGDLDFANRTAFIHGKGDKQRIVPLTGKSVETARNYLGERKASSGPLLVAYNKANRPRLTAEWIGTVFKSQTGFNAHLFRHACASHMLANGCSTRVIQELLGHKFLTTTQRYTHINKSELKAVVGRFHPRSPEKKPLYEDF